MCFDSCNMYQAVIGSVLNKQQQGSVVSRENYHILFTEFDYHFICGEQPSDDSLFLSVLREYITSNQRAECLLIPCDERWSQYLDRVISSFHGVVDYRYVFTLDHSRFQQLPNRYPNVHIEWQDTATNKQTVLATITIDDEIIASCNAFCIANHHAELDVFVHENYRQKGYATMVCTKLIEHLLQEGYEPDWSCWHHKQASINLALKLGFKERLKHPVYVWVQDFGLF